MTTSPLNIKVRIIRHPSTRDFVESTLTPPVGLVLSTKNLRGVNSNENHARIILVKHFENEKNEKNEDNRKTVKLEGLGI